MLLDRGEYTKVAEFNPLQWSPNHTYIALSTTFEATNSRRITDGGSPLWGQVSPHRRPSTVLASMKLYDLINAPHCLRGEGGIITLHPLNVEACRRRAIADALHRHSRRSVVGPAMMMMMVMMLHHHRLRSSSSSSSSAAE